MGNKWKGLVRTLDLNSIVRCYERKVKPKKKRGKEKIRREKEDRTAKKYNNKNIIDQRVLSKLN